MFWNKKESIEDKLSKEANRILLESKIKKDFYDFGLKLKNKHNYLNNELCWDTYNKEPYVFIGIELNHEKIILYRKYTENIISETHRVNYFDLTKESEKFNLISMLNTIVDNRMLFLKLKGELSLLGCEINEKYRK